MDVVHLAEGLAAMVAMAARDTREPEGTMRADGRSASEAIPLNIMVRASAMCLRAEKGRGLPGGL